MGQLCLCEQHAAFRRLRKPHLEHRGADAILPAGPALPPPPATQVPRLQVRATVNLAGGELNSCDARATAHAPPSGLPAVSAAPAPD